MTPGQGLLLAVLAVMGLIFLGQTWVASRAAAMEGQPAPAPVGGAPIRDGLLFFHSETCGPCKTMRPHVERLAEIDPRVHLVDVNQELELVRLWRVLSTPTTVVVRGGRVVASRVGALAPGALAELADELQAGPRA